MKKGRNGLIVLMMSLVLATASVSFAAQSEYGFSRLDKKGAATATDAEDKTTDASKDKNTGDDSSDKKGDKKDKDKNSTTEKTTEQTTQDPAISAMNAAQLASLSQKYSETMKEKIELQENLNMIMESQNNFISRLHELDDMIIEYQDKIDDINDKTRQAQEMIWTLTQDVENAQIEQDAQYEKLKLQIAQEYENGHMTYLDALFQATDYADIVNKAEYIQAADSYQNDILGQLTASKQRLADKEYMLETMNNDMSILAQAYSDEQESLQILSEEKERQIANYDSQIATAEAALAEVEAEEAAMTAQIAQLEASYNVTISLGPLGQSIVYNGADFLWPMPACSDISSYYGPRIAPTAGATSYHRGIDIGCPMGSKVIAVADGVVIYTGYLGTAGNAVIIDHGSGISSCYFHLSVFGCKAGDMVSAGDVVALSGNTGVSTGPHLHFAVRENGEYVNPLKYFKMIEDKSKVANTEGGKD